MNSNLASPKMKKSMAGRGGSGRPRNKLPQNPGPAQQQAFDGLYQNDRLVNSVTSVLGCIAQVTGKSGQQFEGVFKTISSEGSVVLSKAGPVEEEHQNGVVDKVPQRQDTFEQLVMCKKDWVVVEFKDVDLEECHSSRKNDALKPVNTVAKKQNILGEKELEKWVPKGNEDGLTETLGSDGSNTVQTNGWSAKEMFALNEQMYGVKSTYQENMEEYTTKLQKDDTPEYREKEKFAAQKAEEIIKESPYERNMIDSGRSEETLYSSVVRNKYAERPTPQNWRNPNQERPDRDQRSQKVQREGSSSPAMTKREPIKAAQVDEVERTKVKERVVKQEVESSVESKPEINVDVSVDAVKESKPSQNSSSTKPESSATKPNVVDQTASKVPVEANEGNESPGVSCKSPAATPPPAEQNRKFITKELKDFGNNFQLSEKKCKENTEGKNPVEDDEKMSKEKKDEKKKPQPQEPKVASEQSSEEKKVKSALNPNALEFQPSAKTSNPSPIATASSSGTSSPYTNPYSVSPYPPSGVYTPRHMHRGRARSEYMDHANFVNASNAAGQPFFAQPPHIAQFVPQGHANIGPFISPQNIQNMRHPGMQHFLLPAVQHGQGGPMVVPMGPPGAYGEGMYYAPQMIQSPHITSPSLQQHQFNFSQPMALTAQPVNASVRPVVPTVISQQQRQTPVVLMRPQTSNDMQAPQIMAQNRQPSAQNFQGN